MDNMRVVANKRGLVTQTKNLKEILEMVSRITELNSMHQIEKAEEKLLIAKGICETLSLLQLLPCTEDYTTKHDIEIQGEKLKALRKIKEDKIYKKYLRRPYEENKM